MKALLSLLMVYVFLQAQASALSGGPVFTSGNGSSAVGTYAGVLLTKSSSSGTTDSSTGEVFNSKNALGIFSLSSPSTGLATGGFAYFDAGKTYVGSITGVIDPDTLQLSGLVKGEFTADETGTATDVFGDTTAVDESFASGFANGSTKATVNTSSEAIGGTDRLEGTAELDVQGADATTGLPTGAIIALNLTVDGFKQSSAVTSDNDATALEALATSTATGTNAAGVTTD